MDDITINNEHLTSLAAKLDAMELSDDERETLNAVFAAAGKAVAESQEVSGYAVDAFIWFDQSGGGKSLTPDITGGSLESFSFGATSPGSIGVHICV